MSFVIYSLILFVWVCLMSLCVRYTYVNISKFVDERNKRKKVISGTADRSNSKKKGKDFRNV